MRLPAIAACTLALLPGVSSVADAAAAAKDPNQETVVSDIQYRLVYSQEIPGNCGIFGFSQWEAAKFRGWEPQNVAVTLGTPPATRVDTFPVSPAPKYDDMLQYGGNTVSPPSGSHWVLIGDGSYRAGPPPAEADCEAMLARSRAVVPDGKVTTTFQRTSACAAKFAKLDAAKKAVRTAKGQNAKQKAKRRKSNAAKAFNKSCSA